MSLPSAFKTVLGWIGVTICAFYGGFGLYTAVTELLSLAGLIAVPGSRAVPPLFVLHALTGSVALIGGALQLQLASRLSRSRPRVHRAIGWTYIVATCLTSVGGLATALNFDVGWAAKAVFAAWSLAWAATTAVALRRARAHRFGEHREWMVRSFALASVFMIFDIARSAFAASGLPRTTVYSLGLLAAAAASLAVAELRIRTTRSQFRQRYRVPDLRPG